MWLFLEALDVWLFRDGRPFDARSDHRARSVFPPYPTVMQGAVRSHFLVHRQIPLNDKRAIEELVGSASDVKSLRMRGPFLARREGGRLVRYFPQPADAVSFPEPLGTLKRASPPSAPPAGVLTSCPAGQLLGLEDEPSKGEGGLWLSEASLQDYLRGEMVTGVKGSELFCRESRVGIGRNDATRTTEEGALYEVEFIRPKEDVGLLIETNGFEDWPSEGVLRIGGEGRAARFEQVDAAPWRVPPDPLPPRFKLYFATPAYFDGGWQPRDGSWNRFFAGNVELAAAAVGRYESIGGYDLSGGRHKPARRYVPAGSVYYFQTDGRARLRPELVQNAITDSPSGNSYEAAVGFGQVLVEEW